MFKRMNIIFIGLFFLCIVSSKNLILHDYDNPSASHILDATIQDDLLIVSGMIGGIEFYDISNPQNLNHLNNLQLSSGGGGGGTKPNCIVASGNYAYVTTNQGLGVINISNPSNPQYLGIVSGTNGYSLENLDVYENFLAVAAHEDGVLFYDISNPSNPEYITTVGTVNAWAIKMEESPNHPNYEFVIYIADGESIYTVSYMYYNNSHSFSGIDNIILDSAVKDIAYSNGLVYFAKGTGGVDVYQTEGTLSFSIDDYNYTFDCSMHVPCYLDNYNTSVLANRIDTFNNKLAVSDWDDVEILEWDGENFNLVGFKNTTRRTMAIATKDNYIYSAEWASVQIFEYGEINGPDLDLSTYELNYPYVENGESYTMSFDVTNNGNQTLNIIDAYTTNNEFLYSELNNLNPGVTQTIDITYTANSNNSSGSYRIFSNDEDESEIICETNGNINGANIGDIAPDFNLDIIANGSGNFQLSDYIDKVVVLAFFAPN